MPPCRRANHGQPIGAQTATTLIGASAPLLFTTNARQAVAGPCCPSVCEIKAVPSTTGYEAETPMVRTLLGSTPPPTTWLPTGHVAVALPKLPVVTVPEATTVTVPRRNRASACALV